MDDVIAMVNARMQRAIDSLREEFGTIRTGKASPSLVENIVINAYGGTQPLKVLELATIHAQDNNTLVIAPFDRSILAEIEKGISSANVGLNPIVDGDILRINLPPLTEERRSEFVKMVKQKAEGGKVSLRQARHEGMADLKRKAENEGISEDEVDRFEKEIQKLMEDFTKKIDLISEEKEKELMTL
ncbi:MAG TPA: ribosome recycling factor [Patescibacteria group bacterium]|nr:ribosome recycling factor [Patescibacteria group bacterium]